MDVGEEVSDGTVTEAIVNTESRASVTLDAKQLAHKISELEAQMMQHARDLEFEKAARVRDEIHELQQLLINI